MLHWNVWPWIIFSSNKDPKESDSQSDWFSNYSRPKVAITTVVQKANAYVSVPLQDSRVSDRGTTP